MTTYGPPISIAVDACNPGEFFACCGLLELADRLWRGAEGWFDGGGFYIAPNQSENGRTLVSLLAMVSECALEQVDPADAMASPLWLASPFDLRLDWWQDKRAGGSDLKTWAGKQNVVRIAKAMHAVIMRPLGLALPLFSLAEVLFDPADPRNTVEPFYFDNRRACQAHPLDIGFSPDAQGMTIPVHATVEFLCLIGLHPQPGRADLRVLHLVAPSPSVRSASRGGGANAAPMRATLRIPAPIPEPISERLLTRDSPTR